MGLAGRRAAALLTACLFTCAAPAFAANAAKPVLKPSRPIAIAVNGDELPLEPSPRVVGKGGGRLVVPVVRIYSALGIAVSRNGNAITANAPGQQIVLRIGSADATIDGRTVRMEAPAIVDRRCDVRAVALRRDVAGRGSDVQRTVKSRRGRLVARRPQPVARTARRERGGPGRRQRQCRRSQFVAALTHGRARRGRRARSPITSDAKIELQDVVARTTMPGELSDVHVGDAVSVDVLRNGHVNSVVVRYASRIGTIAAVSPSQFVLNTGFIVTADKSTAITLNAEPATLDDAEGRRQPSSVRLNPDTNEKRQIIVSRAVAATAAPAGPVTIASFTIDARRRALRAGDALQRRAARHAGRPSDVRYRHAT